MGGSPTSDRNRSEKAERDIAATSARLATLHGISIWRWSLASAQPILPSATAAAGTVPLSPDETGEGTRFELSIRGFGKTIQELKGFERDRRVTLVPHIKVLGGGHTFVLTPEAGRTRVDHELEMTPRGVLKVLAPIVSAIGRGNLRQTASALQAWLERPAV